MGNLRNDAGGVPGKAPEVSPELVDYLKAVWPDGSPTDLPPMESPEKAVTLGLQVARQVGRQDIIRFLEQRLLAQRSR